MALLGLLAGLVMPSAAQAGAERPPGEAEGDDSFVAPLLPDLRTLPPAKLTIEFAGGGRRLLRLANLVWNSGLGPLELAGSLNPATQKTIVSQRLAVPGSDSVYEYVVGEFVYHPTHAHFHLEDFAIYQVWSLTPVGELGQLVASGDKLSYCLMETDIIDRDNPNFTQRRTHTACGQAAQGILPGWGDRYNAEMFGQTIDVTHLSMGRYALLSTANPDGALLESDYTNNTGGVVIEIGSTHVTVVGRLRPVEEPCRAARWC